MSDKPEANLANEAAHYDFLKSEAAAEDRWPIKYLYDRLGIVDNKTGALARFNGVVIGFLSVVVFRIVELQSKLSAPDAVPSFVSQYADLMLLAALVILAALGYAEILASQIFYLRFDRIKNAGDLERYKRNFFEITIKREGLFRRALLFSNLGNALFLSLFVLIILFQLAQDLCPHVTW
jgi:hypothetical protein